MSTSLCPHVALSFLPPASQSQGWRSMSGKNLPWSEGWSSWFSEGMVWINYVLLWGIFHHEIHACAFTSTYYSLLNRWAHKRIINIKGGKWETVCSNHWHCPSLGHFNWLCAFCGFTQYSFHVNLSTSCPTGVSKCQFISPLLLSQQISYVPGTKFLIHSAAEDPWKKIPKPHKPFTSCISPQGGMS